MDLPTSETLLNSALGFANRMKPVFLGSEWPHIAFQVYTVLGLGVYSTYRIIRSGSPEVVVLSKARLYISALIMAVMYLVCHRVLIALQPSGGELKQRLVFGLACALGMTFVPYHVGNFVIYQISRFGDGPFLVDTRGKSHDRAGGFWVCDSQFVRKVMMFYYSQGLFTPAIIYCMSDGGVRLGLLCGWLVMFLSLLIRIHGAMSPLVVGYACAVWFAAMR